jgi:hypothetical protein
MPAVQDRHLAYKGLRTCKGSHFYSIRCSPTRCPIPFGPTLFTLEPLRTANEHWQHWCKLLFALVSRRHLPRMALQSPRQSRLVLLGEASFALYLIHFLFNDWVKSIFGPVDTLFAALWKLAVVIPVSFTSAASSSSGGATNIPLNS